MSAASSASQATSVASSTTSTPTGDSADTLTVLQRLRLVGIMARCLGDASENHRARIVASNHDRYFSPHDASFLEGHFGKTHYVEMGKLNSTNPQLTAAELVALGKVLFLGDIERTHRDEDSNIPACTEGFQLLRAEVIFSLCKGNHKVKETLAALRNAETSPYDTNRTTANEHSDVHRYEAGKGFDATNVALKGIACVPAHKMAWKGQTYIRTQYPTDPGIFAQLVDEQNVGVVIQLVTQGEMSRLSLGSYLANENESLTLGKYQWKFLKLEQHEDGNIEVRTISTSLGSTSLGSTSLGKGSERTVYHCWVKNWPDSQTSDNCTIDDKRRATIVKSLNLVNALLNKSTSPPPVLVHCNAGVYRSGQLIIAHALQQSHMQDGDKGIEDPEEVVACFRNPKTGAVPKFGGGLNGFGMAFQLAALAIEEQQKTGKVESKQEHKQEGKQNEGKAGSTSVSASSSSSTASQTTTTSSSSATSSAASDNKAS